MKKILTISTILFFIIFLIGNFVYASGNVNMNLTSGGQDSTVYGSQNPNARTENTNQNVTNNINNSATQNQSTINPTVGSTAALSSSSLSLSNILNIILIVLGVLLVLFAIAILLRLR